MRHLEMRNSEPSPDALSKMQGCKHLSCVSFRHCFVPTQFVKSFLFRNGTVRLLCAFHHDQALPHYGSEFSGIWHSILYWHEPCLRYQLIRNCGCFDESELHPPNKCEITSNRSLDPREPQYLSFSSNYESRCPA
jgi:hypothetical protein